VQMSEIALQKQGGTVQVAALQFARSQVSPKTQQAYIYDLTKWFTWLGDSEKAPNVDDALGFREYLEASLAPRSAARIFNTIRVFYRWLGVQNPFQNVKSPRTIKNRTPIVPDDLFVMKMMEMVTWKRDKLVLSLLLNGLRRAEVPALKNDSIEWNAAYGCDIIRIIGKGNKERLVPATLDTSKAYRNYKDGTRPDDPLFGLNFNVRTVESVCDRWTSRAGKRMSPHKLRHHYATRLVRAGAPILSVSKLLGHESVATTQIYVTLDMKTIVEAASLDPMNRKVVEVG